MYNSGNLHIPKGIRGLLIATVVVYIIQIFPVIGVWVLTFGSLKPSLVISAGHIWRLITYIFLHGGPFHLLFNMLALWMFGVEIEYMWGTKRFIIFYFIAGGGSGLFSLLLVLWGDPYIIGASGAVLAILTIYAFYFPNRQILLFFLFPVPVRYAVIIFGFVSLLGAMGSVGGIAHLTHLGGIIIAILYFKYYNQIVTWLDHRNAAKAEKIMRRRAEQKTKKDRYFEETIDPILKKISEQGMNSLTKEEKKHLENASKNTKT